MASSLSLASPGGGAVTSCLEMIVIISYNNNNYYNHLVTLYRPSMSPHSEQPRSE